MTTNVLSKNLEARELEDFKSYLNKKLYRIEDLIQDLPEDAVHLKATCEKFPTKAAYKVSLELKIKGDKSYVYEDDHTITEAVDLAMDKLISSVKNNIERKEAKGQKARASRRALKRSAEETEAAEPGGVLSNWSELFEEFRNLLPQIKENVNNEIRRLEMSGELAHRQLSTDAVIDTLIIDLYDKSPSASSDLSFDQWVYQRSLYVIRHMARAESESNDLLRLDGSSDLKSAAKNVNDLDSDMQDYYQPDETLSVENTVPAHITR